MKIFSFTNLIKNPCFIIIMVCAVFYAPFSNKAFFMDSPVTVYMAKQILVNAGDPPIGRYGKLLAPWNFTELPQSSAFYVTPHPPLVPLYLAPFVAAFGENERILYWAMFPFFVLSVVFFFRIATLLIPHRRVEATLLFALCPVVFVNGQDVMLDVPLMAFSLAAFFHIARSRGKPDAFLAGVWTVLACLTKFTGGTLVLSGILYFVISKKWKECALFLLPFTALYGLWTVHNCLVWGKIQLFANGHAHYVLGDIRYRFERLLSYFGGTIALPVFPLGLALLNKKFRTIAIVCIVASSLWSYLLWSHLHYSVWSAGLYALSASSGATLLYVVFTILLSRKKHPANAPFFLHLLLQVAGGVFLTLYASRYMLPFVFLGVLALTKLIDALPDQRTRKPVWYAMIALSATASIILSVFSFQFADADRRCAEDLKKLYPNSRVFFNGRLGYLYYFDKAGFESLQCSPHKTATGDILIRNPVYKDDARFFNDVSRLDQVSELRYPLLPLRSVGGRAGFYGDDRLPYAWATMPKFRTFLLYEKK
jgi:4-amino-4-deoxy-L-arabinose transferase-like glycosyltransferase